MWEGPAHCRREMYVKAGQQSDEEKSYKGCSSITSASVFPLSYFFVSRWCSVISKPNKPFPAQGKFGHDFYFRGIKYLIQISVPGSWIIAMTVLVSWFGGGLWKEFGTKG